MGATLLLVEDDIEIAQIIRDMLRREGYKVTWATTGLEGWEDFNNDSFDLVLVDLMLPEMDGFTLCKNIRLVSDVPMIIISARTEDVDKVRGLNLGADDYIAKPFSLIELKARVQSHLRRWRTYQGQETSSDVMTFSHNLVIDWEKEIVRRKDQEVFLTDKEFSLLKVLALNPQTTFSKTELYELVWEEIDLVDNHTVTVHIKSLRQKLDDDAKSPHFIQTIWGKGYRFIGEVL